ncbi:MAG: hypothetical protein AAF827_00105 [Cyanobacteria bacterium P01_D01_bin.6]
MNKEELNHQLCEWIDQIRNCVPQSYAELIEEAAYHESVRNELRQQAREIASGNEEWVKLTNLAKQNPSHSSEYRRLMNQARSIAPPEFHEKMEKALDHDRSFKDFKLKAKQLLPSGGAYKKILTRVMYLIQSENATNSRPYIAKKLGKSIDAVPEEIYNDALANTWLWFCENLCRYDSSKGSVINWLNNRLQYSTREELRKFQKAISLASRSRTSKDGREIEFEFEDIDAKKPSTDAEMSLLLESLQKWLKREESKLKREGLREYPQVNCYSVIYRRMPTFNRETQSYNPPVSFRELAVELKVPEEKLRIFFNRKCRKKLQKFID